jgi:tRNA 2-thiouridine synthesizing protein A
VSQATVDARFLLCPLPVIRTQDYVSQSQPGDVIRVRCTDPGALQDIPCWCRIHGHTVREVLRREDEIVITIQVGETG